jgi:hypothetical protein
LESIVSRLVSGAVSRAKFAGAEVQSLAMSSVRATREGVAELDGDTYPTLIGTPIAGQKIDNQTCDGETEFAIFPGELPSDIDQLVPDAVAPADSPPPLNFIRFRPPELTARANNSLPHIRLDRALEFLLGDKLA